MNLKPHIKPFLTRVLRDQWPQSRWQRFWVVIAILWGACTIFAAYGGLIRPSHTFFGTMAPLMVMAFPVFLYVTAGVFVVTLFSWKRVARVMAVTLVAILPAGIRFAPMHITPYITDDEERSRSFKLLTYNVMSFFDYDGPFQPGVPNRTVKYILDQNPDIVCLQETFRTAYINTLNITLGQRNLRDLRYPYQLHWHDGGIALYSKYPIRDINIGFDDAMKWPHYKAARVYLHDDSITIINCHLKSIGLDHEDKNLYHEITDGDISLDALEEASSTILSKLASSFMVRATQAEYIRQVVDSIGGNIIVCGDFNDVPLSYAARTVQGSDMTDAFAQKAFGPQITYHDNRFLFRIDHVFYKGDIEATSIRRDKNPSSDHYPLMVNFMFKEQ